MDSNRVKWGGSEKTREFVEDLSLSGSMLDKLRADNASNVLRFFRFAATIVGRGGNIHNINHRDTAKRRAANRVARKQRKVNRATT